MTQFARFVMVGGVAALANFVSRFLFDRYVDLTWAALLAYGVGMAVAYVLNRSWVFDCEGPITAELGRFVLVNLISAAMVVTVTVGLARAVFPALEFEWHPRAVAHALGVLSPVLASFLAHRQFTFKGHAPSVEPS